MCRMQSSIISMVLMLIVNLAVFAQPPEWTFDDPDAEDELGTWGALNQLAPLEIDEVKDGSGNTRLVLLTESLGGDPYMFPGGEWNVVSYEPFSGEEYDTLYMGVRVNAANTWQVYYVTDADGAWGEVQRQNFDVNAVDDFEDIEVLLERGGWNLNTVLRFRIDPGTAAGIESEIDYISFTGPPNVPQAVEAKGKLSTAWGAVKSRYDLRTR